MPPTGQQPLKLAAFKFVREFWKNKLVIADGRVLVRRNHRLAAEAAEDPGQYGGYAMPSVYFQHSRED